MDSHNNGEAARLSTTPLTKKPAGLQNLDIDTITKNPEVTANQTSDGHTVHGSPSSSPKRDQMVSSPLRSTFVEQRDELFFKFGMKLDHFRKRYDQRVRPLRVVTFSSWGSTTSTQLPEQLGHPVSLDEVVQFILPHIVHPQSVQNHATTFLRLLTEYPPYVALLQDMYWFFFLEFFALAESEERLDRYRLDLLQRLKAEEQSGHGKRRNKEGGGNKDDGSSSATTDLLVAPPINSSHPLWKERLGTQNRGMMPSSPRSIASAKKTPSKPKPINELLVDDDDDDLFESAPVGASNISTSSVLAALASQSMKPTLRPNGGSVAAGNAQDAQEKRKQAFIKKLKRRQLALLPEHVLSSQQAFDFKYVGEAESKKKSRNVPSPDGRLSDLHVLVEGDLYIDDDGADARSDSASAWSVASMPDSVLSARSDDAVDSVPSMSPRRSTTPRVAELVAQAERCRGKRRLVRGEKNFSQSLAMLVEAEEIELSQSELSALQEDVASRSPEGIAKSQAVIALACDLIGREQFRMFGRMAHHYVTALRDLKEAVRAIVAPALSDVIARVITQLLYISAPYARDILTRRTRKVIKRKISYWIGGVESASVDHWGDGVAVPIDDAHRGEMHAYYTRKWGALGLTIPTSPLSRRMSETISITPRRNRRASLRIPSAPPPPLVPVTLPPSSAGTPTVSLAASMSYQSGRTRRLSASVNASPISARGPRARGIVNFPADAPAGVDVGATVSGDASVNEPGGCTQDLNAGSSAFTWSHGAVAYHKALDDILDDFEKMQSGTDGGGAPQRVVPSKPQGGAPSTAQKQNRGRRGSGRQVEEVKHLETHRHAPVNRRSELWHEQGRASYAAVNAESRSRQGQFDLGNVSPFMKRYLRDSAVDAFEGHHQRTSTRLIKWTSS